MKNLYIMLIIIGCLACESSSHDAMVVDGSEGNFEEILEMPATKQAAPPQDQPVEEQITKKVIKTGGVNFQSENIEEDYKKIREILPRFDAYIENENQRKSDNRINYNLTIRVPATTYDSLLNTISGLAFRVDNRYSNIEDVTSRYYDLKTRIKNKKALETRYLALLERAAEMKDILEIESKLNSVRIEIESLEGQFKYLSKQIGFSTINLSFYEVLPYVYDSSQRKGFGARILSAVDSGWQAFLTFMVGVITLWPFFIILAIGIFVLKSIRKKWKKENKGKTDQEGQQ